MDLSILLPGVYLATALLVASVVIALANRWRRRPSTPSLTASDQLAQFRSLYEQGALSEEEFNRLRALLGGQIREALDVPPRPAPPSVPPGSPPGGVIPGGQSSNGEGPADTAVRPG
jgi:hypothetical protein